MADPSPDHTAIVSSPRGSPSAANPRRDNTANSSPRRSPSAANPRRDNNANSSPRGSPSAANPRRDNTANSSPAPAPTPPPPPPPVKRYSSTCCGSRLASCCIVIAGIVLLLLATALVTLYFTVLKPKQPSIESTPVRARRLIFRPYPDLVLNISLELQVTVKNPNLAGFEYVSGMTSVTYDGVQVGTAPATAGQVNAHSTEAIANAVDLDLQKLVKEPNMVPDVLQGTLRLKSTTRVEGWVRVLWLFRLKASTVVTCDITVHLFARSCSSTCSSTGAV